MQNEPFDLPKLIIYGLFLLGIFIYLFSLRRRKKKDIYGFALPGWKILTDDQRLYDIEHNFKYGTVAKTLNQNGYAISDWHSNFEVDDSSRCVTGYIQLSKYGTGIGLNAKMESSVVVTHLKTQGYRYFWCTLKKSYEHLVHINTGNRVLLESNKDVQKISALANQLEGIKGPHSWHLIFFKTDLIILIDELWTQSEVDQFLRVCLDISKQLNEKT